MMYHAIIRKTASACIMLFFLSFLCGLSTLTAYGIKYHYTLFSYYENRNLAEVPPIKKETVLNGSYFSHVETWAKDHLAKRCGILVCDTKLNLDLLKRPVVNETVITDKVLLPYNPPEAVDRTNITILAAEMSKTLASHARCCDTYGGKFYYVAVPCQYVYYEQEYPAFLNSRAELTADSSRALFSQLDEHNVSYIDMLAKFNQKGHPPGFSSAVDNHYGIFGALETYEALIKQINEDTEWNLTALTAADYDTVTLPNPYLGSRERKLLGLRELPEKLSVLYPRQEVPFVRYDWGNTVPSEASVYTLPGDEQQEVLYNVYMGGDISITKIETNRPALPDILIYGDSFTNAVESLLWYNFDTMYAVDFRHYTELTPEEFIKKYKPDIVVCLRDYEQLLNLYNNGQ